MISQIASSRLLRRCLSSFGVSILLLSNLILVACSPQVEESNNGSQKQGTIEGQITAELVLINANVYSFSWPEPDLKGEPDPSAPYNKNGWQADANTIAIADGKIIAIGNSVELKFNTNSQTKMFDLKGATVLPGLVDSHVHIAELGEILHRVNLIGVKTPAEAVARAQAFNSIDKNSWLIGQGWDEGAWANHYPTKEILDQAFPNRPVVFKSLHGFAIWANSKAIQLANVGAKTQSPIGGEILRDENFVPSGIFLNNAGNLIKAAIPKPSPEQFESFVLDGLTQMAKDGYVSIHQAGASAEHMQAFQSLRGKELLPIRVYAMLSARDPVLAEQWIKSGPAVDSEGWLDVRSVKAYYDGALGSRGARMLAGYTDLPDHRGVSGDGYGFDHELVERLMKSGFQVGIHAIGDAGNRETLDYLASVYQKNPETKEQRNRIEHAQVISPEDLPRLAEMSIIASMEPPHAVEDKTWAEQRVGGERILGAYAWRTLRENNTRLTFNSDMPGSDHSIFYGLHSAITRQDKSSMPPGGWYPEQNMTIEEAVRGYTQWSAYSAFREQQTGVLTVGRWADITVMDIDPMKLSQSTPEKILDGQILMTVVNGAVVYQQ
jgi:predicted amidohydrolase YtcJ